MKCGPLRDTLIACLQIPAYGILFLVAWGLKWAFANYPITIPIFWCVVVAFVFFWGWKVYHFPGNRKYFGRKEE